MGGRCGVEAAAHVREASVDLERVVAPEREIGARYATSFDRRNLFVKRSRFRRQSRKKPRTDRMKSLCRSRRKDANPDVAGSQHVVATLRQQVSSRPRDVKPRSRRARVILNVMRADKAVPVQKRDIFARRDCDRVVATSIESKPLVLLPDVDDRDVRLFTQLARDLKTFFRRAVVGDDDLFRQNRLP